MGDAASISNDPVTVMLLGVPVAWARTRPNASGRLFNPTRQRNNTAALKVMASQAMAGREPFDCPVRLDLHAEFPIPATWSKKKKAAALIGMIRPGKKPDLSNLTKQVEDACNSIVFRDDALIVEYGVVRKVYGASPKIVVTIRPIQFPQAEVAAVRKAVGGMSPVETTSASSLFPNETFPKETNLA